MKVFLQALAVEGWDSDDLAAYQGKAIGVADGVHRQVDVEVGPVEMVGREDLYVEELSDRGILEPGKVSEREEEFFISQQQPEAVRRNVRYLKLRSGCAKRCGCHVHAPESSGG